MSHHKIPKWVRADGDQRGSSIHLHSLLAQAWAEGWQAACDETLTGFEPVESTYPNPYAASANPCGHYVIEGGCGGCDPSAVECEFGGENDLSYDDGYRDGWDDGRLVGHYIEWGEQHAEATRGTVSFPNDWPHRDYCTCGFCRTAAMGGGR